MFIIGDLSIYILSINILIISTLVALATWLDPLDIMRLQMEGHIARNASYFNITS